MILVHQIHKGAESLMWQIAPVAELIGRRMRHQNVESSAPQQREPELGHSFFHLPLRILVCPGAVTHRTAKSEDPDSFIYEYLILNAGTALRRYLLIFVIMISMHIQHRCRSKSGQKGQIMRMQISARYNQVDSCQLFFFKMIPQP